MAGVVDRRRAAQPSRRGAVGTLFRLHAVSGLRIGMRRLAPLVILLVAVPVYLGPATVETLVRRLFPSLAVGGPLLWQLGNVWGLLATALVLATVVPASNAVRMDVVGSLRALPFTERERLLAGHLAASAVATPLAVWLGMLLIGRAILPGGSLVALGLAAPSLVLLVLGAGGAAVHAGLPGRVAWGVVAASALQVSLLGLGVATAIACWAGLRRGRPDALRSSRVAALATADRRRVRAFHAALLPTIWSLRAVKPRRVASGYLGAGLFAGPALLFVINNELPSWAIGRAAIFAGCSASVAVTHTLFEAFVERRPPLRWERTLAWTSGRRAAEDLLVLTPVLLPVVLVVGLLRPAALPAVIATQVLLALRWLVHQRAATQSILGAPGQRLLAEGALATLAAAVMPTVVVAAATFGAWPLARLAVRAERDLRVSSWRELSVASERG